MHGDEMIHTYLHICKVGGGVVEGSHVTCMMQVEPWG